MKQLLFFASLMLSISSYGQNPLYTSDTIPLTINEHNTIFIQAIFNDQDTLNLNFDTGYQRTAMLDNDLLLQNKFPIEKMDTIKKVIMKGAKGNEIPVITANLKSLKIGKYTLKNVPIQLLTINKPLKDKNTHILGNEVLKRFNIFLDFQNNIVFLKSNHLFDDKYIDQI